MKFKVPFFDDSIARELLSLGVELGVDKGNVFDDEFWAHLRTYLLEQ